MNLCRYKIRMDIIAIVSILEDGSAFYYTNILKIQEIFTSIHSSKERLLCQFQQQMINITLP